MQAENVEIALNLAERRGYVDSIGAAPIEYYLPGYPVLLTPVVAFFGSSYASAQTLNAFVDGVLGPLLMYQILATFGLHGAGILAALFYSLALALQSLSALALPDAVTEHPKAATREHVKGGH